MEIRPVDQVGLVVEHLTHDTHDRPKKRQSKRTKDTVPSGPVYKPNGELEQEPAPKIDVLV
jgi:hypothetical protein